METLIQSIAALLPPRIRHLATPARMRLGAEFLRFGLVGTVGLLVDTACVYGLRASIGLYGAGLAAYVVAVTATWALNRTWTFRGKGSGPVHRQLGLFMLVNLAGFVLNRGTYAALVTWWAAAAAQPVIGTVGGSLAGMGVNFTLSRRLVFR